MGSTTFKVCYNKQTYNYVQTLLLSIKTWHPGKPWARGEPRESRGGGSPLG